MAKSQRLTVFALLLLVSPLLFQLVSADNYPEHPEITARWIADETGANVHSYRVTFADDSSYQVELDVQHFSNGISKEVDTHQSWDLMDGIRILDLTLNTTLSWGDFVTVTVTMTHYDGEELTTPLMVDREFEVGTWNQPMDDHEIMLETTWMLDQALQYIKWPTGFLPRFFRARLATKSGSNCRIMGTRRRQYHFFGVLRYW